MNDSRASEIFARRRAGILLHPTSLPGPFTSGDLGHEAYRFIEFLAASGMQVWQMLPLGPTHSDGSPYQCLSTHACDPSLISLDWLKDRNLLGDDNYPQQLDTQYRYQRLYEGFEKFDPEDSGPLSQAYKNFTKKQKYWLGDYSLFIALHDEHDNHPWYEWETPLRDRQHSSLRRARKHFASEIEFHIFCQFIVYQQWQELKHYAHKHGVQLFGDLPIYVAHDSVDVWARRKNFLLDKQARPLAVAGVPPDFFSATGQLWGNPLYNWNYQRTTRFKWWCQRIRSQLDYFDLIRIDHFRGLAAYWQIPYGETTAINGKWVTAPGAKLLKTLDKRFGHLPLVAEDLGMITDEVHQLRNQFSLPGMKILQFAFDGNPDNIYLPHNHVPLSVVYTGTHDNDTSLSWYHQLDEGSKYYLHNYLQIPVGEEMPWPLIHHALASVSRMAILPMQDVLALGEGHRMNTPGTTENNWKWRFTWSQLPSGLAQRLNQLNGLYGRLRHS